MLRCLLLYLVVNYNFECLVSIKVPIGDPEPRKNEPPDHVIPYTEHEHVPEPKYVPGNWLKPLKNRTKLDFTPQRLYSQVRRSSLVKKVPRQEALRRAQTDIEKEEAARLKESVSDKKINTFYTEEGFEDAAYDHAGHIRDADFKENYEQDQGKDRVKALELKGESEDSDEDSDSFGVSEEEPRKSFYNSWQESGERTRTRNSDRFDDYNKRNRGRYDKIMYPRKNYGGFGVNPRLVVENEIDLLEKDIEREEEEAAKGAEIEVPENLRELKDSDYDEEEVVDRSSEDYQDEEDSLEYRGTSKFRIVAAEHPAMAKSVESYAGSVYTTELPRGNLGEQVLGGKEQFLVVNTPKFVRKDQENLQNLERSEENYVYPTLAQVYETWKRRGVERMYKSGDESIEDFDKKLNRVDEIKKPRKMYLVMVRPKKESNGTNLDPKKKSVSKEVFSTTESGLQENVKPDPRYRYQRKQRKESQFGVGRDKLMAMTRMVPPLPNSRSEYAKYHNLRRNGSIQPQHDRPRMVKNLSHQSALRFGESRPSYFVTGNEKGDNEKVSKGWKNNRFISRKFVIVRKKRGVFSAPIVVDEVVDGELDKRFPEDGEDRSGEERLEADQEEDEKVEVEVPELNYAEVVAQNNEHKNASDDKGDGYADIDEQKYPFYNLMEHSTALKYVINPSFVPRKTLGGLEFYDSRDKYMTCDDVEPDLSEEVPEKEEPGTTTEKNLPRLKGLGDKLLCLKEKYFDEKPLDNPLFVEKQIAAPTMPTEMDPEALRARFEGLTDEGYEDNSLRRMSGPVDLRPVESRIEESNDKKEGKWNNHAKKYRKRKRVSPTVSPYQREVYDDVMGTIKNLATMYKGVHVLSTRPPPEKKKKKKRQESREKNDQVRINTSSRHVVIPLRGRVRHPKLGGYRTNRVSYRTRPMMKGFKGTDGKVVGFFKTVRVHKRDLGNVESGLGNVRVFDSRRIGNVSGLEGKNLSRVEDKNSRPRGAVRFGRFQDSGGQGRRNEPRYTALRKFDEVFEVETKGREPKKEVDRYDVHEEVQEGPEKTGEGVKEIYRPAANENAENENIGGEEDDEENEEGEYEGSSEGKEKDEEDEEEEEEEDRDGDDGSEYAEDSESKSGSEEAPYDAERNYEEKSEGEKEFERFSYRPFSSYESYYDPKYANLGPRVNKPAFHHPSFDSEESKTKDSEESEEGYVFPWHEDEEDDSEESRRHERFTRRHEYPWDRRDRVRREREKKYGPEWSPSESKTYFRKAYPWERYSVPWKYGGRRRESFWPDDEGYGGDKYPKSKFKFKKLIGKGRNIIDPSTTSTPQIPATEEAAKVEATTPLILTTTPIAYTARPRSRRPVTQRSIDSLKIDQAKAQSSPRVVKTVPDFKKSANRGTIKAKNSSNLDFGTDYKVRKTSTIRPPRKSLDNTTPSSRKVEHRSKVSKEEIITMSFPKMASESAEVKDGNSSTGKIVQKVSIVTKETPEHIYRTQEIDKNGVRDTIISVIPNNRTGSLESMSIDRLDINSNDGNNNNEQSTLDISLPSNKNLQLTEHGTRKVISSVSWIAENYDY